VPIVPRRDDYIPSPTRPSYLASGCACHLAEAYSPLQVYIVLTALSRVKNVNARVVAKPLFAAFGGREMERNSPRSRNYAACFAGGRSCTIVCKVHLPYRFIHEASESEALRALSYMVCTCATIISPLLFLSVLLVVLAACSGGSTTVV
jgi:hypothetical protein